MLKPGEPAVHPIGPDEERPVGDLVHRLVEDGKAYARAEVALVKTIAASKGKSLAIPAALIATALLFAIAAVTALAVGVLAWLAKFVGPLAAGLITMVIFLVIAGALGWFAISKARKDL